MQFINSSPSIWQNRQVLPGWVKCSERERRKEGDLLYWWALRELKLIWTFVGLKENRNKNINKWSNTHLCQSQWGHSQQLKADRLDEVVVNLLRFITLYKLIQYSYPRWKSSRISYKSQNKLTEALFLKKDDVKYNVYKKHIYFDKTSTSKVLRSCSSQVL